MGEVTIIKARHVKEVSFSPDELKLIVKKFNGSYHIFILQLAKTLLLSMMLTGKEGRLRFPQLREHTKRLPNELWDIIVTFL